ncbi:adenylate kinase [Prochlorococcus sp. MIT 1341]|uniref:adenylate kinase n=1 Tax=Prochlorococcus sp. MIT 1341 TaxID=3096221 RepID=UPI002A7641F8|nr:adenylate kinase [Prochlorococcus sp. MIT 1341]
MKKRLLFLGPPGAGKGTQAKRICEKYSLSHLSTGDLLRAEVVAKTDLGNKAAVLMANGELVTDDLVLSIVETKLKAISSGWLLDGFPRTVGQAEALERILVEIDQLIEAVVLLELNDDLLIERLLLRGRDDDNQEVITNRLDVYRVKTEPLIDYFRSKGLIHSIQADGSVEEITQLIESVLKCV